MKINETRKEDDVYYRGLFWIVTDSCRDIQRVNFKLVGEKCQTGYAGGRIKNSPREERLTHKQAWAKWYYDKYGVDYNYYPRGRVEIYNGVAYINLNSLCNTPKVIDRIMQEYNLGRLEVEIEYNDLVRGNHYDFQLQ